MKHFKASDNNFINSGRYSPCLSDVMLIITVWIRHCMWPCLSAQICIHDGKVVIIHHNIYLGVPDIHSLKFVVFSHLYWQTCSTYLAFDGSPQEAVWYCTIKQMGGPGVPETPDGIQKLKTSSPSEWWCHSDLIIMI